MAEVTGTLILRPVASRGTVSATVPSDTSIEDCYKLVNEQSCDGETTYFTFTPNETAYFHLSNNDINNIISIDNVTLFVLASNPMGNVSAEISIIQWSDGSVISTNTPSIQMTGASSFVSNEIQLSELNTFSTIKNLVLSNDIGISIGKAGSAKATIHISQVYLEVSCVYSTPDVGETDSLISFYTKQNDAWTLCEGILYKKSNDIWNKINISNIDIKQFAIEKATYVSSLLEYTYINNAYCVSGIGECTDKDIIIPKQYKRVNVSAIGDDAFRDCDSLTSVVIPDSVTSINSSAFRNCDSLTSVVIPDSVTSIGNDAFYDCDSLTSVVIPDSVTSVGSGVFRSCDSLTSAVIPDSITSIGGQMFSNCDNLTNIIYPGTAYQFKNYVLTRIGIDGQDCTIHCADGDVAAKDGTITYHTTT